MKKVVFKIITISIGLILGLLLGEIGTRIYVFGINGLSYKQINSVKKAGKSGYLKASTNTKVLYELKPNINDVFKMKKFKTNAQGFRDKAYTLSKPDNTIRGIVIGDSFTMGSGVKIEDTYHSKIEKTLNQNSDSVHYELLNFGVSGYNLLNYFGVMEEKVMQYNPDFLIVGFCSKNDFLLPNKKHTKGIFKEKKISKPFFSSYLYQLIDLSLSGKSYKEQPLNDKQKAFISEMFSKYSLFSRKKNIPIIITYLSIEQNYHNMEIVRNLAIRNELPFAHQGDKFKHEASASYQVNILDAHPNARSHQIFSKTLLSFKPFLKIVKAEQFDGNN